MSDLSRTAARGSGGTTNAPRNIHDAGASAGALVHRYARRRRGEVALRRPARLRRIVARRAFLGDHRADPVAADVHGGPRAAHQEPELRHRRDLPAEPPSGERRRRSRAVRSHEPRPLHARHRRRRAVFRFRTVRQRRPRRARAQDDGIDRDHPSASGRRIRPTISRANSGPCASRTRSFPSSASAIMPKPFRKAGPPISMSVSSRNSPTARVAATARLGHHLRQQYAERRHRLALADLQQGLRRSGQTRERRQLARRAQHHGGAERRRSARPRVQRAGLQPLFLHLHARSAVAGRPARRR